MTLPSERKEVELKGCPFCGGKEIERRGYGYYSPCKQYFRICVNCKAQTDMRPTSEEADELWNTRAARAGSAKIERADEMICHCGLSMSKNPHPQAGNVRTLTTVGADYVCIPCTVESRHKAYDRQRKAENELDVLRARQEWTAVDEIKSELEKYDDALLRREHGGVAAGNFVDSVRRILNQSKSVPRPPEEKTK